MPPHVCIEFAFPHSNVWPLILVWWSRWFREFYWVIHNTASSSQLCYTASSLMFLALNILKKFHLPFIVSGSFWKPAYMWALWPNSIFILVDHPHIFLIDLQPFFYRFYISFKSLSSQKISLCNDFNFFLEFPLVVTRWTVCNIQNQNLICKKFPN